MVGPAGAVHYLDNENTRTAALADPHGFVRSGAGSTMAIDEIQLGGDALIRAIKAAADANDERGQFLLNGSANFLTVPHITESLAGRAVFLTMLPLSQGEIAATDDGLLDLSFADQDDLLGLGASPLRTEDYVELICRGGFPEPVRTTSRRARHRWFNGYVSSVAAREITRLDDVRDADLIPKLLRKDPASLVDFTDPARGPLVELFALNELRKQALLSERRPELFHYRDHRGDVEVDLVAEAGGEVVAWEVKASSSVSTGDTRGLCRMRDRIDEAGPGTFRNGVVLHAGSEAFSLGDRLTALPLSALWTAPH